MTKSQTEGNEIGKQQNIAQQDIIDCIKGICMILIIYTHTEAYAGIFHPLIVGMAVPVLMTITGMNYSRSLENKGQDFLYRGYYSFQNLWRKTSRIYFPWIPVFLLLSAYGFYKKGIELFDNHLIVCFLGGGLSNEIYSFPGNYYIIVMLQIILLFPLLHYIYCRKRIGGGIAIIICVMLSEAVFNDWQASNEFYRLTALRYFPYIWGGIDIWRRRSGRKNHREKAGTLLIKVEIMLCLLFGAGWLLLTCYGCYSPVILKHWTLTAWPAIFWVYPIVRVVVEHFAGVSFDGKAGKLLVLLGKSSFHIFIMQGLYYKLLQHHVLLLISKLFGKVELMKIVSFLPACIFSLFFGFCFWKAESYLRSLLAAG